MTSTLTQYEFDRLELALQNSRHHWVQPKAATDAVKRPLQLAFEEIENLRKAKPIVESAAGRASILLRAAKWALKYPKSSKARRVLNWAALRSEQGRFQYQDALLILGRKANVCRPDGTEEHA